MTRFSAFLIALSLALGAFAPGARAGTMDLPVVTVQGRGLDSGELLWEGFESGATQWTTADATNVIDAAISKDVASQGQYAFGGHVDVPDISKKPHAGFYLQPDADFRQIKSFCFDLFNGTTTDWDVTVVFQTGPTWDWNESAPFTLHPGWNRNLGINDFGRYQFPATKKLLSHPDDVVKVSILCAPRKATQGALYLDNVRVSGAGAPNLVPRDLPGATTRLVDSFENPSSDFKAQSGAALRTEPDPDHATLGHQGLRLVAVATDPDENAVFDYEKDVDLSGVETVLVDVYNPGPPAMLAFNESFGADWGYAEGPGARLRNGWNYNVAFNLLARDFKGASSNWKANAALPSLKVRKLGFTWSPGDTGRVSLTIDNLRFRAVDDVAVKALASAPEHGYETPLWNVSAFAPTPRSDNSTALGAFYSPAYTLSGEGPSLRLQWKAKGSSDAADYQWAAAPDLRGVEALRVDVYNASPFSADLGLVLKMGPGLVWTQSRTVHLAPGWNEGLEIPLEGGVFKSSASGWAYTLALAGRSPSDIGEADWHVEPSAAGLGTLYIARAVLVRHSLAPGSNAPIGVQATVAAGVNVDNFNWFPWDSGAGEGTFEKGLSAWQGLNGSGFDASVISVGTQEASQGKYAMRVDMRGSGNGVGNDKCGVEYNPSGGNGPAIPDLSKVHRIRLDVFNPGRPLAIELAFSVSEGHASDVWVQSAPVALTGGWNHDVTFDLDSSEWQSTRTFAEQGASFSPGLFPPASRGPGQVNQFYICFVDARFGTVWVDNIRFGRSGNSTTQFASAELALQGALGPLELKASIKAGKQSDSNDYVEPGSAHAVLHGAGQTLALSYGEAVPAFDDVLGIYTGRMGISTGLIDYVHPAIDQVDALRWEGGLGILHAEAFGALPWGPAPYSFGGDAFGGARFKAVGDSTWLGGTVVQQRLGYSDADIINGTVQQDSQTLEIDGGQSALGGNLGVNVGWGTTYWGQAPERMLLHDAQGNPVLYSRPLTPTADALNVKAHWTLGPMILAAGYSEADTSFDTTLSDTLNNATSTDGKATLKFDRIDAVKNAFVDPGILNGLGRGMEFARSLRIERRDPEAEQRRLRKAGLPHLR
jgi:hypothetical protein